MHDEMRTIAMEAARAGAAVLREHAGRIEHLRTKSTAVDLVSEVDVASGVAVVRAIRGRLPRARFVVEEPEVYEATGTEPASLDEGEVWVIDPLDGTTSYVHSYPCYSVSVALVRDGRPIAGAVLDAASGRMHAASAGGGATLDDLPLAVAGAATIETSLLVTGFPYDRGEPLDRQLAVFTRLVRRVHGVRRDGSAALDMCHIAAGRADGFWEFGLKAWDTAAGAIVAEEAGAVVTGMDGERWTTATSDVIVANRALHPVLLDAVREALAAGWPPCAG